MEKPKNCVFLPSQELIESVIEAMIAFGDDDPDEFIRRFGFDT